MYRDVEDVVKEDDIALLLHSDLGLSSSPSAEQSTRHSELETRFFGNFLNNLTGFRVNFIGPSSSSDVFKAYDEIDARDDRDL